MAQIQWSLGREWLHAYCATEAGIAEDQILQRAPQGCDKEGELQGCALPEGDEEHEGGEDVETKRSHHLRHGWISGGGVCLCNLWSMLVWLVSEYIECSTHAGKEMHGTEEGHG